MEKVIKSMTQDFLDAAFDGEFEKIKEMISEFEQLMNKNDIVDRDERKKAMQGLIDCRDKLNTSALSEAACGGQYEIVKFLLSKNANPNSKGAHNRTPLSRAASQNHLDCMKILLENGADPRINYNYPDYSKGANELVNSWNIEVTIKMLNQFFAKHISMKKRLIKNLESDLYDALNEFEKTKFEFEQVENKYNEYEEQIEKAYESYFSDVEKYKPLIQKLKDKRDEVLKKYNVCCEKYHYARYIYKEISSTLKKEKKYLHAKQIEFGEDDNIINRDTEEDDLEIKANQIYDLILRDRDEIVKNSKNKWPLLIDSNKLVQKDLNDDDLIYVNLKDIENNCNGKKITREGLRKLLVEALRNGKPLIFDAGKNDSEGLNILQSSLEKIDPNLFEELLNKSIIDDSKYLRLLRPEIDGEEYSEKYFNDRRAQKFKVIFITTNRFPCDELLDITLNVKVVPNSKPAPEEIWFF